jgi:OOP family OmpA-OmpF porin
MTYRSRLGEASMRQIVMAAILLAGAASTAAQGEPRRSDRFLVFFDTARSALSKDASGTLDEVVAAYRDAGAVTVDLSAYSDRFGSEAGNRKISAERGAAVRDYLTGCGIPVKAVTLSVRGESDPLVETADGVMEPQNRRVEIVIGPGSAR